MIIVGNAGVSCGVLATSLPMHHDGVAAGGSCTVSGAAMPRAVQWPAGAGPAQAEERRLGARPERLIP